jgi:hypothetical protein
MKPFHKLAILVAALIMVNLVTWLVVTANQGNAIYPIGADSISIPLFSTFLASLFVLPFFAVIAIFPTALFIAIRCSRNAVWSVAVSLLLVVAYVAAAVYAVTSAAYWAVPHHYLIAICYALLVVGLAVLFILDARFLFSNSGFQTTSALTHLSPGVADLNYETILTYSEPLIRQAVLAFWRRSVGVGFMVALLLVALGLAFYLLRGEASWVAGVLGTVFAFGVLFIVALYFTHYRNSLAKFRDMGSPNATFRVDDSSFTISSDAGTATLQWSVVKELWQTPNAWLLLYSKAHFSTLPIACLSPEMRSFILQRVQAAGGKIVD